MDAVMPSRTQQKPRHQAFAGPKHNARLWLLFSLLAFTGIGQPARADLPSSDSASPETIAAPKTAAGPAQPAASPLEVPTQDTSPSLSESTDAAPESAPALTPELTMAWHWYERAQLHYLHQRYAEALPDFERTIQATPRDNSFHWHAMMGAAHSHWSMGNRDSALRLYHQVLALETATEVHEAARQMIDSNHTQSVLVRATVEADEPRLVQLVEELLPQYTELTKPIHVWWVDDSQESRARIEALEVQLGIPQEHRVANLGFGWMALSSFHQQAAHYLYLKREDVGKLDDFALRGLLAHEMVHMEMNEVIPSGDAVYPGSGALAFESRERLVDLIVIGRGFGAELAASREMVQTNDLAYPAMRSVEIRERINSRYVQESAARTQSEFALALCRRIEASSPVAREEWQAAVKAWTSVLERDKKNASALYEIGIAHQWLDQTKEARNFIKKAVKYDKKNPYYRKALEDLESQK